MRGFFSDFSSFCVLHGTEMVGLEFVYRNGLTSRKTKYSGLNNFDVFLEENNFSKNLILLPVIKYIYIVRVNRREHTFPYLLRLVTKSLLLRIEKRFLYRFWDYLFRHYTCVSTCIYLHTYYLRPLPVSFCPYVNLSLLPSVFLSMNEST